MRNARGALVLGMLEARAAPVAGGPGFGSIMTETGFLQVGAPDYRPYCVRSFYEPLDPTGHGAFVQGMLDAMFPTLRGDIKVSVLKGLHEGSVSAARRGRDSRTWERLCRRWASKHPSASRGA